MGNLVGISVQLDQDSTQLGKHEIGRQYTAHCTETAHNKNLCTVAVKDDDRYGPTVSKATYDDGRPTLLENDGVYGPALEVRINDVNGLEYEGVVQKDEGLSIYDIPGLKYCPGGELPVYTYTGYKPSTSTKKDPTLVQLQVQVEAEDIPEENSINKLIAEWEVRGNKPEDSLKGEEKKGKRRKSAQFQKLSNLFEGQGGVMGACEGGVANLGSVNSSNISHKISFSGVGGQTAKVSLPRPRKIRVLRRVGGCVEREILLASPTANGKRILDEMILPGSDTKKRRKGSD